MELTKNKKRPYNGLYVSLLPLEGESSIMAASIVIASQDVTVDPFETVKDSEENDYFKVTFE